MTSAASANKAVVRRLVAEGDKVVGRFTCSATHRSEWLGQAPTGRRFERVDELAIFRLPDDADPGSSGRRKELVVGPVKPRPAAPSSPCHSPSRHSASTATSRPVAPRLQQPATVALGWVESDRPPQRASWTRCS
jgi:hypothetical protein